MKYASVECEAIVSMDGAIRIVRRGTDQELHLPSKSWTPGAPMIMLELDRGQRIALSLPECEAVNGGTALCLLRADMDAPLPAAPTSWGELVVAELLPMTYFGHPLKPMDS